MCELFGVSGKKPILVNDYLKEFISHSKDHPNGWGLAVFDGDSVNVEKEPVNASKSRYLQERLRHNIEAKTIFSHIRYATKGSISYLNSHPFVRKDDSKRTWTLIHNGTIFECAELDRYVKLQEGTTDSERILYYMIDKINERIKKEGRDLEAKERFEVIEQAVYTITRHNNKVNLLIYDGELFYVHCNMRDTLHQKKTQDSLIISTVPLGPLDRSDWEPVPLTTLQAYKEDELVFSGRQHDGEYIFKEEDMKYLYLELATL